MTWGTPPTHRQHTDKLCPSKVREEAEQLSRLDSQAAHFESWLLLYELNWTTSDQLLNCTMSPFPNQELEPTLKGC